MVGGLSETERSSYFVSRELVIQEGVVQVLSS